MHSNPDTPATDETLDHLGRAIVRAAADNQAAAEGAAASPFLYARIRARIAAEEWRVGAAEEPAASDNRWLPMLARAWRAIPVMALLALAAAGVLWSTTGEAVRRNADPPSNPMFPVAAGEVVQACALSNKDECSITTEDVLSTIVKRSEREVEK